ncbi:MAG TPA: NAD+ synthase [Thermoplasmata archaeon]|nr:NAD+ synthase [Thermoplasmata archaeon]
MSDLIPTLPRTAVGAIHQFLRAHAGPPSGHGGIVGLSGGLDSAVTARLARDALGPERVLGVLLPDPGYPESLQRETREFAEALGIEHRTVPLGPSIEAMRAAVPEVRDRVTLGNMTARLRMTLLYALARERERLVLGTGNKSELLLGYFTKYGDGGVDVLPLGDLYKTQVRALAVELDIPGPIRERAPTAGFWEGQTDEGEIGLPYETIDRILYGFEQLRTEDEVHATTGVPLASVHALAVRVAQNRHKRRLPPIPKLGLRTVGLDWRD